MVDADSWLGLPEKKGTAKKQELKATQAHVKINIAQATRGTALMKQVCKTTYQFMATRTHEPRLSISAS